MHAVQLIREGGLFGGSIPPALAVQWSFKTPEMATIHEDATPLRSSVASVLEKYGLPSWRVTYWERLQVSPYL